MALPRLWRWPLAALLVLAALAASGRTALSAPALPLAETPQFIVLVSEWLPPGGGLLLLLPTGWLLSDGPARQIRACWAGRRAAQGHALPLGGGVADGRLAPPTRPADS